MTKHHRVIRQQARCKCGMRSHNNAKMTVHFVNRSKKEPKRHEILQTAKSTSTKAG